MNASNELRELFNLVHLPSDDLDKVYEYLAHHEWGIALEHFCATLLDEKIEISERIFSRIKEIGEYMELGKETWENIASLVRN